MANRHVACAALVAFVCSASMVHAGGSEIVLPAIKPNITIGAYGKSDGQFRIPSGLAFSKGELFVVDTGNARIEVFDKTGRFLRAFGNRIESGGNLITPTAINIGRAGDVFIADAGASSILVYDSKGTFKTQFGAYGLQKGAINYPTSLRFTSQGELAVVNTANDRVDVYSAEGIPVRSIESTDLPESELAGPSDVAFLNDGTSYVVDSGNHRIAVFDPRGKYLFQFGSFGRKNGQFRNPSAISVVDNKVFVVDNSNHRIQIFDLNGRYQSKWGMHPLFHEKEARFHYPMSMTLAEDGETLAVSQPIENVVSVFTKVAQLANAPTDPHLDHEATERLYQFHYSNEISKGVVGGREVMVVSETDVQRVAIFDVSDNPADPAPQFKLARGEFGEKLGQFKMPEGVTVDKDGNILVADRENRRIESFTPAGEVQSFTSTTMGFADDTVVLRPSDIEATADGSIYIVDPDNHRVVGRRSNGQSIQWGGRGDDDGKFNLPLRLESNDEGSRIYVVDRNHHRIQIFDATGKFIGKWGSVGDGDGQFISPLGIAVAPNGDVYVTDVGRNNVQIFTADGQFKQSFGKYGNGEGEFYFPTGVAVDSKGRVYVSDFGNHRGQVFDAVGTFLAKFGDKLL